MSIESKFIEVDGVVIEVRDYGYEQLCRVNQKRDLKLIRTFIGTHSELSYDDLIAYLVKRENSAPAPSSTHRIRLA